MIYMCDYARYELEDQRLSNPTLQRWFKLTYGKDASLYQFGQDGYFMLGLDGKLWRFHESNSVPSDKPEWLSRLEGPMIPEWFSRLEDPMIYFKENKFNLRRRGLKKEYEFECEVLDFLEADRRKSKISIPAKRVHIAPLENVNHALIRLQRWIRRVVVRRGQIRLALLMGLHARLGQNCTLSALGHDLILGLLVKGASAAKND